MLRIVIVVFFLLLSFAEVLKAQPDDNIGSGRAIQFDGIDDYIDLGDRYDNVTLPITISVWLKVSPGVAYALPIFNSQDNLPLYNGFTFTVTKQSFAIQYGDGQGENLPLYRRGKSANNPNIDARWVNLTAIMRGRSDMDLFLNGVNIGGQYSGDSNLPMASAFPADVAKIGYWYSNGITTHFKGLMDELRIFNRSLSETEIREQMCRRLTGNEPGLIGYWTFDETGGNILKDKSPNHFDGQVKGNPVRIFSGAPIGDESLFLYTTNWSGKSLKLDAIEAVNILGSPSGIHIYKVHDNPSQTNGLNMANVNKPYYGVFVAGIDIGNSFGLKTQGICKFFIRNNNSIASWSETTTTTGLMDHKELVVYLGDETEELDLGPDQIVCNQNQIILQSNVDVTGKSVLWNTNETTGSITVKQSGVYSLQISSSCVIDRDTIQIQFLDKPPLFSLGNDEWLCEVNPKILKPFGNSSDYEFKWQDGSTGNSFNLQDFGKFWLSVKNPCGSSSDTIQISRINEPDPPIVDLGPDQLICNAQQYVLKSNLENSPNAVRWSTGETTRSITVTQPGVYKVQVSSTCKTHSDSVKITFQNSPPSFSLGDDETLCLLQPKILKPFDDSDGFKFRWQDGSSSDSFEMNDFGEYWLEVSNACGTAMDTVKISRLGPAWQNPPNIITPNGDPLNQYFIVDTSPSGSNRLHIFNRWGENVFSSQDYQNNWDGAGLSPGVYFYQLSGNCVGEKKGTITISR